MTWPLLVNSLLVAGGATLGALALGFLAALGCLTLPASGRSLVRAAAVAALVQPPFLVANTWMHYLGSNGPWQAWLPFNLYSLPGTLVLLALMLWPISFFLALASWQSMDRSLLEAEPALAGTSLLRWLLGPLAWPHLKLSVAVTFVLALNNFTIPAILQVKVLPAALWIDFNTSFAYGPALARGWPLVLAPLLLLVLLFVKHQPFPGTAAHPSVTAPDWSRRLGPLWRIGGRTGLTVLLVLSVGLPLAQLVLSAQTWAEIPVVLRSSPGPIRNSLALAAVTALACLGMALATHRCRLMGVLWLPFLVPGVLLGVALIHLANRPSWPGLYPSAGLVVFSWMLRYQAFTWQGLRLALERTDPDLKDAARLGGAGRWMIWRHVYGPAAAPWALGTAYLTYLLCLWDVETLILLVPPGGETLALRVFNLLHYGHIAQVNAMCLLLLGLGLLPLGVWTTGVWLRHWWNRSVP